MEYYREKFGYLHLIRIMLALGVLLVGLSVLLIAISSGNQGGEATTTPPPAARPETNARQDAVEAYVDRVLDVELEYPPHDGMMVESPVMVTGRVLDSGGFPVSGAEVVIEIKDQERARCVTPADGSFAAEIALEERSIVIIGVSARKGEMYGEAGVVSVYQGPPAGQ